MLHHITSYHIMQRRIKQAEEIKNEYIKQAQIELANKKIIFSEKDHRLIIKKQRGGLDNCDPINITYYAYHGKIPIIIENNRKNPILYMNEGYRKPCVKFHNCFNECKDNLYCDKPCNLHDEDDFYSKSMFEFLKMIDDLVTTKDELTKPPDHFNDDFCIVVHK